MKNENICVYETDKTSKFVVDTLSNVENKMKKHLKDDLVISDKKIRSIERNLNSETDEWIDILQIGRDVKQLKRTKFNMKSTHNPIPILRGTSKDHKVADDPKIGPDLRPIMGARIGPNTSMAQIACKMLRAISESFPENAAIKSTEELLRTFENYNNSEINPSSQKVLFSMDIKSFYPSLDPVKAAAVARKMWDKSPLVIQNVDYDKLVRYLSKKMTNEEIENEKISELLYKKKKRKKKYCKNLERKTKHTNVNKNDKNEKQKKQAGAELGQAQP